MGIIEAITWRWRSGFQPENWDEQELLVSDPKSKVTLAFVEQIVFEIEVQHIPHETAFDSYKFPTPIVAKGLTVKCPVWMEPVLLARQ